MKVLLIVLQNLKKISQKHIRVIAESQTLKPLYFINLSLFFSPYLHYSIVNHSESWQYYCTATVAFLCATWLTLFYSWTHNVIYVDSTLHWDVAHPMATTEPSNVYLIISIQCTYNRLKICEIGLLNMEIQNLVLLFDNQKLFISYIHFILYWFKLYSFYNSGKENCGQLQILLFKYIRRSHKACVWCKKWFCICL